MIEIGGEVGADVERTGDHLVARLDGVLSRSTAPQVAAILDTLLAEGRAVLVDLARLRLGWARAVEVFPAALRIGGGWPVARLVLFAADADLLAALQAADVPNQVPIMQDRLTATARRDERPEVVHRYVNLLNRPASGRFARHTVEEACHDWHIPHLASVLALIADELVTNAVHHTDGAAKLTIGLRGSDVTVSVRDELACSAPRPQLSCVGRPCGRGLQVVTTLARRWGVTQHTDGKTVWADLSTVPPPPRPLPDEETFDDPVR